MDRASGLSVRLKLTLKLRRLPYKSPVPCCSVGGWLFLSSWGIHPPGFYPRAQLPATAVGARFAPTRGHRAGVSARVRSPWEDGFSPAGCSPPWLASPMRPASPRLGRCPHRIRLPGRRDEFRELADAFDTMLARLEAQGAEQQRFAANASHELRTPLAITQTLLDVARNDPSHDTDELVNRLHAVNTRAIDLTEALLLLSRPTNGPLAQNTSTCPL